MTEDLIPSTSTAKSKVIHFQVKGNCDQNPFPTLRQESTRISALPPETLKRSVIVHFHFFIFSFFSFVHVFFHSFCSVCIFIFVIFSFISSFFVVFSFVFFSFFILCLQLLCNLSFLFHFKTDFYLSNFSAFFHLSEFFFFNFFLIFHFLYFHFLRGFWVRGRVVVTGLYLSRLTVLCTVHALCVATLVRAIVLQVFLVAQECGFRLWPCLFLV